STKGTFAAGCRFEAMDIGCQVEANLATASLGNYFIGNFLVNVTTYYAVPYQNVIIDRDQKFALDMRPASMRTFVRMQRGSGAQSIPIDTWTKVGYNAIAHDHLGEADGTGNDITVTSDGVYLVSASVLMAAGTAGTVVELAVYVNGVARNSLADRKSTRLNSSHVSISYAVFCLKKKKNIHAIS